MKIDTDEDWEAEYWLRFYVRERRSDRIFLTLLVFVTVLFVILGRYGYV